MSKLSALTTIKNYIYSFFFTGALRASMSNSPADCAVFFFFFFFFSYIITVSNVKRFLFIRFLSPVHQTLHTPMGVSSLMCTFLRTIQNLQCTSTLRRLAITAFALIQTSTMMER